MIKVYPYDQLGHAELGWLTTRYHFSFAEYYNPERMGFGTLRVVNDDIVKAGAGFDIHPHRDMEIITFIRHGAISHKDSRGNKGRTEAGNVQVMSAGTGIYHSEFNLESEDTSLFQIWIKPNSKGVNPRWDAAMFTNRKADNVLPLLVSGREEDEGRGALYIHQDAAIYAGQLGKDQTITQPIKHQAYLLVSTGEIDIQGDVIGEGDSVEITGQDKVVIKALTGAEVIVIDVPAE